VSNQLLDLKPANKSPPCDRLSTITAKIGGSLHCQQYSVSGLHEAKMRLELEDPSGARLALHILPYDDFTLECKTKAHPHFILNHEGGWIISGSL